MIWYSFESAVFRNALAHKKVKFLMVFMGVKFITNKAYIVTLML